MSRKLGYAAAQRWLWRKRLYRGQNGRCWHCGEVMVIFKLGADQQPPARYATFEHLVTKRAGGGHRGRPVLACLECNQKAAAEETFWIEHLAKMQEDA